MNITSSGYHHELNSNRTTNAENERQHRGSNFNSMHCKKNTNYISPMITSLPSFSMENQLIVNAITSFKPPELAGAYNNSTPGLALLTDQQKLANLQQQIKARTIYTKAKDNKK